MSFADNYELFYYPLLKLYSFATILELCLLSNELVDIYYNKPDPNKSELRQLLIL